MALYDSNGCTVRRLNKFSDIIKEFPISSQPQSPLTPLKHTVSHQIDTTGLPTHTQNGGIRPGRDDRALKVQTTMAPHPIHRYKNLHLNLRIAKRYPIDRSYKTLSQYIAKLCHVKGKDNFHADVLSRNILSLSNTLPIDYVAMFKVQATSTELREMKQTPSLKMKQVIIPEFRRNVYDHLHGLSYPGIRATQIILTSTFIWSNINKDVCQRVRTCIKCQCSKVNKHTVSPPQAFQPTRARFSHIHIDLVGPLPCSDVTEVRNLIVTLGKLMTMLGLAHHRTTSYHTRANGMEERFRCQLKLAIYANLDATPSRTMSLYLILFAIPVSVKEDIGFFSAKLVLGSTIRLPGEFLTIAEQPNLISPYNFAQPFTTANSKITQDLCQ
ncbi:unnamed protein product [Lepeophtheirus salmonis]|uniref:RNA-directed DNA polymerase n=1 Tax=Lepeophtheirus salmonis TaxID=72036 RepID=A0A7R8H084_LEPSM|nr:unnamed protein product [Lepeophtheirus salmonis]CAF2765034.1 unnamed protein product [Lepeophtheirus salmonis]